MSEDALLVTDRLELGCSGLGWGIGISDAFCSKAAADVSCIVGAPKAEAAWVGLWGRCRGCKLCSSKDRGWSEHRAAV